MMITNAQSAREWLASWEHKPRVGIKRATLAGLMKCEAIARSQKCPVIASEYRAAINVITGVRS